MNTRKSLTIIGYFALSCLFIFGVGACSDKDIFTAELPSLSIGTDDGEEAPINIDIPATGGSKTFSIVSNGPWKITKQGTSTDWVTVTPDESNMNNEVVITIAPNTTEEARKLSLRFAVDGAQVKTMTISQLGFVPSIAVSPKPEESFVQEGGDITFTVTTNDDVWSYTIQDGADWLTEKEKTATTLTLTVSENSGALPRTANIRFNLENYTVSDAVTFTQEGKELEGYRTKLYGTKLWMIENLNEAGEDGNLGYVYNNDPNKAAIYGRLYTWHEAMTGIPNATAADNPIWTIGSGIDDAGNPYIMDGSYANSYNIQIRGACPEGWHVPNMNDWYDLVVAVKQEYNIPGNTLSDVGATKDGYIIAWDRERGVVDGLNFNVWGVIVPYFKGSRPKSEGGLWDGGTTFSYTYNASFPALPTGAYPLYKDLSSEVAFNILPSGYRNTAGSYSSEGLYSYHWIAFRNPNAANVNPQRLTIGSANVNFSKGNPDPREGMCLRCVANY